jgi:hypothetical protein
MSVDRRPHRQLRGTPDALGNLAAAIILDTGNLTGDDPAIKVDRLGDALELVIGEPELDHVLGTHVAVWDKLRDVLTRLKRLEDGQADEVIEDPVDTGLVIDRVGHALRRGDRVAFPNPDGGALALGTVDYTVGRDRVAIDPDRSALAHRVELAVDVVTILDGLAPTSEDWPPGQDGILVEPRAATDLGVLIDRIRNLEGVASATFRR